MTQPQDVQYASERYQIWLRELKERALLQTHNQSQAMFRAVFQVLRRHLTTEQVLAFADALPPLPRGIFIEGWRPAAVVPLNSAAAFVEEVIATLSPHQIPPGSIVADVFAVLAHRVAPHEARAMREQLPEALKLLWP